MRPEAPGDPDQEVVRGVVEVVERGLRVLRRPVELNGFRQLRDVRHVVPAGPTAHLCGEGPKVLADLVIAMPHRSWLGNVALATQPDRAVLRGEVSRRPDGHEQHRLEVVNVQGK